MKTTELLDKAVSIAKFAHQGQVDKAGVDYIKHPLRVMNAVDNVKEKIVAVLHYVVEDSEITLEDLRKQSMGSKVNGKSMEVNGVRHHGKSMGSDTIDITHV